MPCSPARASQKPLPRSWASTAGSTWICHGSTPTSPKTVPHRRPQPWPRCHEAGRAYRPHLGCRAARYPPAIRPSQWDSLAWRSTGLDGASVSRRQAVPMEDRSAPHGRLEPHYAYSNHALLARQEPSPASRATRWSLPKHTARRERHHPHRAHFNTFICWAARACAPHAGLHKPQRDQLYSSMGGVLPCLQDPMRWANATGQVHP